MTTPVARKRFGQHFLHDRQVIQRIVDAILPTANQHLVEIGPGAGALTLPILDKAGKLDVIELDRDLVPILQSRFQEKAHLTVYQADALTFDFNQLITDDKPLRLIGNLPYNISTPLIFHLLTFATHIQDMHFMLQKEVVDRMAAKPGTSAYGRLSIMVQYHCQVISLFNVAPIAFDPPPKVDSSIVRLIPYRELPWPATDYACFADLVKTAFAYRRKTLRNALRDRVSDTLWEKAQIDSTHRPEQLRVEDYVKLANLWIAQ